MKKIVFLERKNVEINGLKMNLLINSQSEIEASFSFESPRLFEISSAKPEKMTVNVTNGTFSKNMSERIGKNIVKEIRKFFSGSSAKSFPELLRGRGFEAKECGNTLKIKCKGIGHIIIKDFIFPEKVKITLIIENSLFSEEKFFEAIAVMESLKEIFRSTGIIENGKLAEVSV